MRRGLLPFATLSMLVVASCSLLGAGSGGTIEGVRWILTGYEADGGIRGVPDNPTVDAIFTGGTVSGSGGCNSYTAPYTVAGSKLTIGQIASTLMMCEGVPGTVESAYFAALQRAASFTATATDLQIIDESGKAVLFYRAGPSNPLVGAWTVTGYNNGAGGVVSPTIGTSLTATFGEDGTLSGSAGCNTYNGTYALTGQAIAIGPLATTRKACEEPVMAQETAFLAALQAVTGYRINGEIVTLTMPDGENVANAVTLIPAS